MTQPTPRARSTKNEQSPDRIGGRASTLAPSVAPEHKEMLVSIRSHIKDANLERVCLIVGGVPFAPRSTAGIRPGDTSSMVELPAELAGKRGAVYFELCAGAFNIPLITDELFDIVPGAVLVITIGDFTRAHNAAVEIEGAVARLALDNRGADRRTR